MREICASLAGKLGKMKRLIMTRDELMAEISSLPQNTDFFVRTGPSMDDAYPAKLRIFNETIGLVGYFEPDSESDEHRNWPEGHNGAVELFEDDEVEEVSLEKFMLNISHYMKSNKPIEIHGDNGVFKFGII